MTDLVHIFNISQRPLARAVHALATEIMPVSRLKHKSDIIKIKSICEIPKVPHNFDKDFNQVALDRAIFIWKKHIALGVVSVLWSGGIDSTVAVAALLMTVPQGHILNIYCNLNSILENKEFYTHLLKLKNVRLLNSSLLPENEKFEIVTGDLGDQIFGSELLYRITHLFGFDQLMSPYQNIIPRLFLSRCGNDFGPQLYQRYLPIIDESPIQIKSAFDFIWWWNFTQKWQGVKFRKRCFLHPNHEPVHFFDSDEFQLWSLFAHDKKIDKKIETYKQIGKDFIYSYDRNEIYRQSKKKLGSPYGSKLFNFGFYEDGTLIPNWNECQKVLSEQLIDS